MLCLSLDNVRDTIIKPRITLKFAQNVVLNLPSIGAVFSDSISAETFIKESFESFSPKMLNSTRIEFMCHCNEKKIRTMYAMLTIDDLKEILENGPFPVETICHNCGTPYYLGQEDVRGILGGKGQRSEGSEHKR